MKKRRGFILPIVMLVLTLMVVVGSAMTSLGTANLTLAANQMNGERAYQAAEAGLNLGCVDYVRGSVTTSQTYTIPESPTQDTATVQVFSNPSGTTPQPAGCPVSIPQGFTYIYSTGHARGGNRTVASRSVGGMLQTSTSAGSYAIMARDVRLTVAPATIVPGPLVGVLGATDAEAANVNVLATNATVSNSVQLGVPVSGKVVVPQGGLAAVDNPANALGGVVELAGVFNFPRATTPHLPSLPISRTVSGQQDLAPGRYSTLTLDPASEAFLAGTYVIDQLIIGPGARMFRRPNANVKLYVLNTFTVAPNQLIVRNNGYSNQFQLTYLGAGAVSFKMDPTSACKVMAPNAHLTIQAVGEAVGALAADWIDLDLSNGSFKYDRSASSAPPASTASYASNARSYGGHITEADDSGRDNPQSGSPLFRLVGHQRF